MNLEALEKWVGHMPDDVIKEMAEIAPMLEHFGYDPNGNPPKYGIPDDQVVKNTNDIIENESMWEKVGAQVKKMSKKDTAPRGKREAKEEDAKET